MATTDSSSITFFNCIINFPFLPFLLLLQLSLLSTFPTASDCARPSRAVRSAELHFMRKLFRQFERKSGKNDDGIGTVSSRGAIGYAPTIEMKKCAVGGKSSSGKLDGGKANLLGWGMKFALKKLAPGERYVRAELHLYTRGHMGTELAQFSGPLFGPKNSSSQGGGEYELIRVVQFVCDGSAMAKPWPDRKIHLEVAKLRADALGHTMPLSGQQGWSTFDAMTLLMYAQMDELSELYINFLRNGKPLDEVHLRRFIRNHRPFLVVYTTDAKKANGMDKFNKFAREKREVRATVQNYANHEDVRRHMDTVRETAEYYSYGMAKSNNNAMLGGGGELLPRNSMDANTFGKLKRRRKMKIRKSRKSIIGQRYPGFDPNDPMLGFGTPYSPWQRKPYQEGARTRTMQSPNSGKSLNDIRALREHTYREVNKPSGEETKKDGTFGQEAETKVILLEKPNHSTFADEGSEKKCSLHNMTVDFREIGWSARIIAPKSFEAGFCACHCDYPLEQESNPTNHAILQSLIATHRLQQNAKETGTVLLPAAVPATVCCAPDRFDSLTLLYFDEHDNVVLKNYPKMVALSCGCL